MKIYILDVQEKLQPSSQRFRYPGHNKDYGVEQDFLVWLKRNPGLLTNNPEEANWHYLPIFWTRWHINHDFAKNGVQELQTIVNDIIIDDSKTFTITQYDDGPVIDIGQSIQFLSSRNNETGIDIPLLCSKDKSPFIIRTKKYLASFNGNFETHAIRKEMLKTFSNNSDVVISGNTPRNFIKRILYGKPFIDNILRSYIGLAPRGYGGSSFRFYEIMQLGIAPCLIGEHDVRPFKKFIDWDKISYYVKTVAELEHLLINLNKEDALVKGRLAKRFYKQELKYQSWCKYVIQELKAISD